MWLRANVVLAVAVVFAVVQMFASVTGGPRTGDSWSIAGSPDSGLSRSAAAQEEDNDDDEDNDGDDDDEDDDNDDDEDEDNDDEDDDNDDDGDNDDDCDDVDNVGDVDDDNLDGCDDDNEDDDNDDSDNDDDDNDDDNEDSDNDDDDSDNDDSDGDNSDDESDDDDSSDDDVEEIETAEADNGGEEVADSGFEIEQGAAASPSLAPGMEVEAVTTGADVLVALPGEWVSVQVFASTPPDVTLILRMVDPIEYPATPGIRAGDLIFQVQAFDAFGTELETLPADVTINAWYTDPDVAGLDETMITMSRLDPYTQMWQPATNIWGDQMLNLVTSTTMDTGIYAVNVP